METESTVDGAEELELGTRRKLPKDTDKQCEIQRLKDCRNVALRHMTK